MSIVTDFFKEFYTLVSEMAPYLLFGFLFAGLLKAFFPAEGIERYMGKRNFRSVFNAACLGCLCRYAPVELFRQPCHFIAVELPKAPLLLF